jgi:hypothetical protein
MLSGEVWIHGTSGCRVTPPTTLCPIPLGDNLSETAGQKNLRDAPVVIKLTAFFGDFFCCRIA